jgi:hypothetical protein
MKNRTDRDIYYLGCFLSITLGIPLFLWRDSINSASTLFLLWVGLCVLSLLNLAIFGDGLHNSKLLTKSPILVFLIGLIEPLKFFAELLILALEWVIQLVFIRGDKK